MTKFNSVQKINTAIRYQNRNESIYNIAKSFCANYEVVRMWVKQFESHGIHVFKKGYTSYLMEYKLDVLNYMNENGTSPNETAVIFNISSPALIRKWRTQLRIQRIDALA